MPSYKAPVDDVLFLIKDVLKVSDDLTETIVRESAKLAEEVVAPTNQSGDSGCIRLDNGDVKTPLEFKKAYNEFRNSGWMGLDIPEKFGGQGLSYLLATVVNEFISSANMAFGLYPGLTHSAMQAILKVGTEEQKQQFVPKMATGQWTGTMNLTEPHCGTDLGLLKTKATRNQNGTYNITGHLLVPANMTYLKILSILF